MTRFLKLKNILINTSHITRITHIETKDSRSYVILMNELDVSGFNIFGIGCISNHDTKINVELSSDPLSYQKIRKWIEDTNPEDFTPNKTV